MKRVLSLAMATAVLLTGLTACADGIVWPGSVKIVPEEAFLGDISIKSIEFKEGVTTIESGALKGCQLSSIVFPQSVTSIADDVRDSLKTVDSFTAPDGSYARKWAQARGIVDYDAAEIGEQILDIATQTTLWVPFTAPSAGIYTIESLSEYDIDGCVQDESNTIAIEDWDSGEDYNFLLEYDMYRGQACLIGIMMRDATESGSFTLKISRRNQDALRIGRNSVLYDGETTQTEFTAPYTGSFTITLNPATLTAKAAVGAITESTQTFTESTVLDCEKDEKIVLQLTNLTAEDHSAEVSIAGTHAVDDGKQYRALLIGQTYPTWDEYGRLFACDNDAQSMAAMLNSMQGTPYTTAVKLNLTAKGITNAITDAFACADENDVSLVYYSGHGDENTGEPVGTDYRTVSIRRLKDVLDDVPGDKIVILDSCYSGMFIKGGEASTPAKKNRAIIDVFADPLTAKGDSEENHYYVLTSCSATQMSWSNELFGFFTYGLLYGSGYDEEENEFLNSMEADKNSDSAISLSEGLAYARETVNEYMAYVHEEYPEENYSQDVQAYPSGSGYTLWKQTA